MSTYNNGPGNVPRLPDRVVDTLISGAVLGVDYQTRQLVHTTCEELLARLPAPVDLARAGDEWRVGEHWSSANPDKRVLVLAIGAREIESHGKHPDFIRWVGGSTLHTLSPADTLQQAKRWRFMMACAFNDSGPENKAMEQLHAETPRDAEPDQALAEATIDKAIAMVEAGGREV
jgi:hypothetical protein